MTNNMRKDLQQLEMTIRHVLVLRHRLCQPTKAEPRYEDGHLIGSTCMFACRLHLQPKKVDTKCIGALNTSLLQPSHQG